MKIKFSVAQVIVTEKSDYVRLGANPNQLVTNQCLEQQTKQKGTVEKIHKKKMEET